MLKINIKSQGPSAEIFKMLTLMGVIAEKKAVITWSWTVHTGPRKNYCSKPKHILCLKQQSETFSLSSQFNKQWKTIVFQNWKPDTKVDNLGEIIFSCLVIIINEKDFFNANKSELNWLTMHPNCCIIHTGITPKISCKLPSKLNLWFHFS